jgi:uncharacterized membrane protein
LSEERRNYGVEPESRGSGGSGPGMTTTTSMSPRGETTWSVLAHLSVFVYRDRSERVSFHALQSALYQLAWAVILAIGWTITGLLTVIIIGFLLIPVMIVLSVVPFVHMAYAAYKVNQGVDYRYPFVADLIGGSRGSGTL